MIDKKGISASCCVEKIVFYDGDIVKLKSGGPRMTVELRLPKQKSTGRYQGYICVWFNKAKEVQRAEFSDASLVHCTD